MRILVCILAGIVIMTSCKMSRFQNGIKGNGKKVSQEIKIDDYNSINIEGKFDLVYEQEADKNPYLRIEIDENLQEYVSTTVKDSTLTINTTQEINPKHYKIYTNSTNLSDLSLSGINKVELKDSITSENLRISASGIGDIKAKHLLCQNLDIHISGLAHIVLGGESTNVKLDVSGKGGINAYDLKSQNADCSASGMGSISVYSSETLAAHASGMGKVNYKGNPREKELSESGMGSIKAKE